MNSKDKPLVWFHSEVKSPPFSQAARIEAGYLLRQLQIGVNLSLPQSRPMSIIGQRCHELRIDDYNTKWRIIYRIDDDAIVLLDVFEKKSQKTPKEVIDRCRRRIKLFEKE